MYIQAYTIYYIMHACTCMYVHIYIQTWKKISVYIYVVMEDDLLLNYMSSLISDGIRCDKIALGIDE